MSTATVERDVFVINEATCSRCGLPWADCKCRTTRNQETGVKHAGGTASGSSSILFGTTGEANGHVHYLEVDSQGYGRTRIVQGHTHEVKAFRVQPADGHTHPLEKSWLLDHASHPMVQNLGKETPLGTPTWNFDKPDANAKRKATIIKQLVGNAGKPSKGGEPPMGQLTWALGDEEEPCDNCDEESEIVANDNDGQPMPQRTWSFD